MKVFIITREAFPNGMASTNRILAYTTGLVNNNMECEVIISRRTESQGKTPRNNEAIGVYEGVKFRYIGGTVFRSEHKIVRTIQTYTDYIRTFIYCLKNVKEKDIILNIFLAQILALYMIAAARIKKAVIIRELNEYPYATKEENNVRNLKKTIELNLIFPLYNGFIVISDSLKEIANRYKSDKAKIVKIPILVNPDMYNYYIRNAQTGDLEFPYIYHPGTLVERKDGILSNLKAFAIAVEKLDIPIKYIISGPPSRHMEEIKTIIEENNLQDRIIILGILDRDKVALYLEKASLAILNKNDNIQNYYGFSTKLGEILLSETAVITTTVGEANNWLENNISAYIVNPHEPELIAEKIVQAFSNEEERRRIALEGKKTAEREFNYNTQAKRLISFFESFSKENKN